MANIAARDGSGSVVEIYAKGVGTPADPYRYTSEGFLPFAWKVTVAGTGYAIDDRLLLKQESNETFQWYKITSTGTVSGLGNTNIPAANRVELGGGGGSSSSIPSAIAKAVTANGTEYTVGQEVLILFSTGGAPTGGYNLDTNTALTAAPVSNHFNFSSASSTASGGVIAVTYDVVGGTTGLQGAWDVTNAQVRPKDGSAAIAIGTTTGNATNLAIAGGSSTSTATQTFQYTAIQNNATAGVVSGRRYDRRRLINTVTNAVLTPDAWTDYELGTELNSTQIAAINITADFDPNTVTTTTAVALRSQDWIVVPNAGDTTSGLTRRAIAREYVAENEVGTVTAPFWTNANDTAITAPNRNNLVRAETGYPEAFPVEYAINLAPAIFLNGFAIRLPGGAFDLYSDYALSTLVPQGVASSEAIAASIRPRTVASSGSGGGVAVLYNIVGSNIDLEGAWDVTNAQVRPRDGGAALTIGTATGNATNLRFPNSTTDYVDYRVDTAHNGLTAGVEVRENITSTGITWTLSTGGALPGATPIRANLTRIGGTTVESFELNTGAITPNTQRVTLATDDALNTEVIANNPILYDDGATLGIEGRQIIVRNKATGIRTVTNLTADYSVAIPGTATNIRPRTVSTSGGGGGVAVLYDVVGGTAGLEGAWDITNAQVRPRNGGAAITIGTATGNATNLRFPNATTDYVDYRVDTAHNGLLVNAEVRETITASGITWTLSNGGALPGATPIRANLTRIGGTTVESFELNTGAITANTQRFTLATDDALNTEVIANNPILYDDGATLGIEGRQIIIRNKVTGNRTVSNLTADYSVAIPGTATNIRADSSSNASAILPLTAIANSTKIIEVPEPGDAAVAGTATIAFRPAAGALALSSTAADFNGIPANATAVYFTVWPSTITRNGLGDSNQAYLAGLSLIYTVDGTVPSWGSDTLAPNGIPLKFGDRLILNRADALRLRILSNSDTSATTPTSPGRPQITFHGLEGTAPEFPIYQVYDWSIASPSGGSSLSSQLPASLGAKAGAQSLSVVQASDSVPPPGAAYESVVTVTRAANTTAYTANDVYGPLFELPLIGPSGGHIILTSIDIIFALSSVPAGMAAFYLYLYKSPPASALTDNSPFGVPSGDRTALITPSGLPLGNALLTRGGGTVVAESYIDSQVKLETGQTSLWAYLVTGVGFTPDAVSETYQIRAKSLGV